MPIVIDAYNQGSHSARNLKRYFRDSGWLCKILHERTRYRYRAGDVVLNWGRPERRVPMTFSYNLNPPTSVFNASNKVRTFQRLQEAGVNIPEWTTDREVARGWWNEGATVLARHLTSGNSGRGIEIIEPESGGISRAPLYTKYVKKQSEFRVHVFNGLAIDVQEKRKVRDYPGDINTKIRSHDNGWVFCREDVNLPEEGRQEAVKAVRALNLDFGAVDLIWNRRRNMYYVLEVNTAPGLEGESIPLYGNAFLNYARSIRR